MKNSLFQSGDKILLGDCESVEHEFTGDIIWKNDKINTLLGTNVQRNYPISVLPI